HVEDLIESALNYKLLLINLKSQRLDKEKQEVKNISEPAAKHRTRITSYLQNFKVIHKESAISLNNTPQISPVIAITHDLPTEELEYSLSIGDEHLSTILEKESDEVIKSSVENLVPIPSESEVTSDNESECDVPVCDDSSPLNIPKGNSVTFSNPLFDSNDDFTSSDNESLSDEDVPKDVKIYSNPLFEFDDEYISSDVNTLFDKDECFTPSDNVELLLHYDPSISVVSILEGFTDEPLLEENEDLFDLESKEYDWKKILYDPRIDDLISEDKVFDPEIHEIIFFSNIWKLIL
ncbi:hypothetical protein Tco_0062695, partial [Tanacetum coccineum]